MQGLIATLNQFKYLETIAKGLIKDCRTVFLLRLDQDWFSDSSLVSVGVAGGRGGEFTHGSSRCVVLKY